MPRVAFVGIAGALLVCGALAARSRPPCPATPLRTALLRVTTLDGTSFDLTDWSIADGKLLATNGPEPWQRDLRDLWLLAPIGARPEAPRGAVGDDLVLRSGARLSATLVGGAGSLMRFRLASGGFGEIDLRYVASLRLGAAAGGSEPAGGDEGFAAARAGPGSDEDLLFVRRSDAKIQRFRGRIAGLTDRRIHFRSGALAGGRELNLALGRCYGIVFGRLSGAAPALPERELIASVRLADRAARGVLRARILGRSKGGRFRIRLLEGMELALPLAELAEVELCSPRLRHLSRLRASNEILTRALGRKWPVVRDRDQWGRSLAIGEHRFRSGLVLVPNAMLSFEIGAKRVRLLGRVGIPKAPVGSARVRILADGREIAGPFDLRADGRVIAIDETLTGVRELTLDVRATGDLDSGSRVVFGDFRLVTDE